MILEYITSAASRQFNLSENVHLKGQKLSVELVFN